MSPLDQFYAEYREPREGLTLIVGSTFHAVAQWHLFQARYL